jgi:hypothetical protein
VEGAKKTGTPLYRDIIIYVPKIVLKVFSDKKIKIDKIRQIFKSYFNNCTILLDKRRY